MFVRFEKLQLEPLVDRAICADVATLRFAINRDDVGGPTPADDVAITDC